MGGEIVVLTEVEVPIEIVVLMVGGAAHHIEGAESEGIAVVRGWGIGGAGTTPLPVITNPGGSIHQLNPTTLLVTSVT